jgi:hypothetical protein
MNVATAQSGGPSRAMQWMPRVVVLLLIGVFALFPAIMPLPHHPPPPPLSAATRPMSPRSCIDGACQEAARCIQAIVKHVILRLPATPLLLLALLLALLPIAIRAERLARRQNWWWPPGRRRALLQVFLI